MPIMALGLIWACVAVLGFGRLVYRLLAQKRSQGPIFANYGLFLYGQVALWDSVVVSLHYDRLVAWLVHWCHF